MTNYTARRITILFAVMVVAGGALFVGGVAATEHVDTLMGDGTDEIADFEAAEDRYIEYTLDSTDTDFGTDGTDTVVFSVTLDGYDYVDVEEDVEDADASHTFNVSMDTLEKLPGGADETVTVEANATGLDADGAESTTDAAFDVGVVFDSSHAAIHVQDAEDDDFATFEEDDGFGILGFNVLSSEHGEIDETVAVNGDNTTVQVYVDDSDIQNQIDAASDGADDGDRLALMMSSTVDGSLAWAYSAEPGETLGGDDVNESDDAYIVVNDDDHISVYPSEDAGDEIDTTIVANDRPSAADLREDLDFSRLEAWAASNSWLSSLSNLIPMMTGTLLAGTAVTRRRTGSV